MWSGARIRCTYNLSTVECVKEKKLGSKKKNERNRTLTNKKKPLHWTTRLDVYVLVHDVIQQ